MIRVMTEEDVEKVYDIAAGSFSDPWSMKLYADSVKNEYDYNIVCEKDGEIAAFAILSVGPDVADIADIAVDEKYRKNGIADSLMNAMIDYANKQGVYEFALEVRKSNAPAISLYKKYEFEVEAVRKRYYKNPEEDALIMFRRKR